MSSRDHISSIERFRDWSQKRGHLLADLALRLPATALHAIRAQRDAVQEVVHALSAKEPVAARPLEVATQPGLTAAPFRFLPHSPGLTDTHGETAPEDALRHLLGRAMVDLLLSPDLDLLRRCAGTGCHKVFVAQRTDRRWCDSRVCGNRTRVANHARRAESHLGQRE